MPSESYWNGEEEVSYRAEWERAVNGNRSRVMQPESGRVNPQAQYGGAPRSNASNQQNRETGYYGYVPLAQSQQPSRYQAPRQQVYQQPAYQPQQTIYQQPVYQQVPQPEPVRKGRRRATGFYIFISWTALFLWAAFIYYMSSHTSSELAQGIFAHIRHYIEQFVWTYYGYVEDPVSPICHFGEYLILGALLGNALHCHMPFIPATLLAIAISSGYGYTDEIHQLSVAGRMFDLEDWKIDTAAAAIGSCLMTVFYLIGSRRERV